MVRPRPTSKSRTTRTQPTPPQPTIPMNEPTNQPFSLGVQTCLGRGKGVHISTPSPFESHLNYTRAADKQKYAQCCERWIIPCKCIDKFSIAALGVEEEIYQMFNAIGWRPFLNILCPAFVELVRKFYATFEFDLPTGYTVITPNVI
mgnify:CR=1 FL=1